MRRNNVKIDDDDFRTLCCRETLYVYYYIGRPKRDANFLGFSGIFLENLENVEIDLFNNIYLPSVQFGFQCIII